MAAVGCRSRYRYSRRIELKRPFAVVVVVEAVVKKKRGAERELQHQRQFTFTPFLPAKEVCGDQSL